MRTAKHGDDELVANEATQPTETAARFGRAHFDYLMQMPLTRFQRLALWTTAITYFLILVGGLVRASGAGLGSERHAAANVASTSSPNAAVFIVIAP